MKNHNDMTVRECIRELLGLAEPNALAEAAMPLSLDEAVKLREGWQNLYITTDSSGWFASAIRLGDPKGQNSINATGTTELEARFRLRVAVERLARQGEGGGE